MRARVGGITSDYLGSQVSVHHASDAHVGGRCPILPLLHSGLGAEDVKVTGTDEVTSNRAIGVLECHNEG